MKAKRKSVGKTRAKPGTRGAGKFYRIEIRPSKEFKTFRTQDVGERGGLERVAGKREKGSWDTVAWLVSKKDADIIKGKLILTGRKTRSLLKSLKAPIEHVKGDIFKSSDANEIAEKMKPTFKMRKAQMTKSKK